MKKSLINIIRTIREVNLEQDAYMAGIPGDISSAVFDNRYAELQDRKATLLMRKVFKDSYEDVVWFLYEFRPGSSGPHLVLADGAEYTFNTDEDYYAYLRGV